jgi:phosphoribosyl 1,2-cyclic phosphodiesterase
MHIRCWGSRGSIPVSGKEYIRYGGDTTCVEIRTRSGHRIIIDAGTGIRSLGNQMVRDKINTIDMLFTHAHWDHLLGFPFFKPIFRTGTAITIRCNSLNNKTGKALFEELMSRPFFPVQLHDRDIKASLIFKKIPQKPFAIGSATVRTIPLSHPKDGGTGFRFEEDGKSFVFLTDNELGFIHNGGRTFDEYCSFCSEADLLIHDAEYEEKEYRTILKYSEEHWGHSTVSDALRLGLCAGVKKLGLFHLNAMRTDEQVDTIVRNARAYIKTTRMAMECFAVGSSFEVSL